MPANVLPLSPTFAYDRAALPRPKGHLERYIYLHNVRQNEREEYGQSH
jgi:hypothetical protein